RPACRRRPTRQRPPLIGIEFAHLASRARSSSATTRPRSTAMAILTKPTNAPGTSLSYVTIGAILTVVSGTSYYFFTFGSEHAVLGYLRMCGLILGVAFLTIGFAVGRIGQVSGETQPVVTELTREPTTANGGVYTTTNTTRSV